MRQVAVMLFLALSLGCCKKLEVVPGCPPPPMINRVAREEVPAMLPAEAPMEAQYFRLVEIVRALVGNIVILEGEVKSRDIVLDTYRRVDTKKPPTSP